MKRIIAIAIIALAATSAAQASPDVYHFSSSESFSTYNVYKVEPFDSGRQVRVYYINGGENFYTDKTGDLLARILENQPEFTKVTGTQAYVNPGYAARINCSAGTSTVSLQNSAITVKAADNCAMANEIAGKAK